MSQHPRIRRTAKWTGLMACVVIVIIWAWSLRASITHYGGFHSYYLKSGVIRLWWGFDQPYNEGGAYLDRHDLGQWGLESPNCGKTSGGSFIMVPLWFVITFVAIPTAFLFYRDRRRILPGHCQKCAYDLTGNESGVCPECGTAI